MGLGQWFLTLVRSNPRGSVCQFQGFGDTHFIFVTTKGSINACIELVEFSTSNKVKNHWSKRFLTITPLSNHVGSDSHHHDDLEGLV